MSIFLSKLTIYSLYFYFRAWMLSAICIANLLLPRVAAEGIGGRRPWDSIAHDSLVLHVLLSVHTGLGRGLGPT